MYSRYLLAFWTSGSSSHHISFYLQHRADDLAVSQDLGLEHLMLLQKLHLGLQIAEVGSTVLRHLLHPLRHPLVSLTDTQNSKHLKPAEGPCELTAHTPEYFINLKIKAKDP